ncbi:MAG: hypothetical protein RLZZ591_1989 [Pseudomonadota bacterium]|jgi:heme ABC exporter ATP-binding subunit CcmA
MLELKHLRKTLGQRVLFDDLSLVLAPGHVVALLGPSGCGKSTLLRIVAGLEASDSGSILMDGQDITAMAPERRRFALMFQDYALFPHLDVQDNVAFGLVEQGLKKRDARAQAQAMLARFGLAAQAHQQVWTLSGGEQQRVALARALVTAPRVLLLDEPFAALDADLRSSLREEFGQHIKHAGMATLMVTHDEVEARAMASQGVRLVDGRLMRVW